MGLDGKASFRELEGRAGGRDVSRSREDRWLMDFLRAHHDGQLIGANSSAKNQALTRVALIMASMTSNCGRIEREP